MARESTESLLRDLIVKILYERIGEAGSFDGQGKHAHFWLKQSAGGGDCQAEGSLDYVLPSAVTRSHKTDILVSLPSGKKIAVELVCLSSVPDHFKARSYDMLHLKQAHGSKLIGVLVYVHVPGTGISLEAARAICHPYDEYCGVETADPADLKSWLPPIVQKLEAVIQDKKP